LSVKARPTKDKSARLKQPNKGDDFATWRVNQVTTERDDPFVAQ
jgi:hypothetical protein